MIEITGVSKKYGKQQVLSEINLKLNRGDCIALIGPNGSGKTTLIKSILGLVLPDIGNILVDGQNINKGPDYRKLIGHMPQLSEFPEQMKVHQLFSLIKKIRNDVGSHGYNLSLYNAFQIEKLSNKKLVDLSGGMKQQVSAALAFLFKPNIIILDEPTASLDPFSNELLKIEIQHQVDNNKLLIVTSHILSDLDEICNHVIYLMEGKIIIDQSRSQLEKSTGESKLNKMIIKSIQNIS